MGERLPPKQLELYKKIDEILWHEWDPIGVSDVAKARDEYYSYLPQVFGLVIRDANQGEIAKYLYGIETETMGLWGNKRRCSEIAARVLEAKGEVGL